MDYSSLRFDFALTRKPMLFLVPDLASYSGPVRGFLYDYPSTAPGPLLDTADEVVECLSDLAAVEREHKVAYETFLGRFQYLQDGRSAVSVVDAFFGAG
jgi:CDP-glycerol glycerophosphotransferase